MAKIELDPEEYAALLWAAIHDDRRIEGVVPAISAHWDELPQHWRNKLNERAAVSRIDYTGTAVLRERP